MIWNCWRLLHWIWIVASRNEPRFNALILADIKPGGGTNPYDVYSGEAKPYDDWKLYPTSLVKEYELPS